MEVSDLEITYGHPFKGAAFERFSRFLERQGFEYEGGADFTIAILDQGEIVAAGALDGNVIRYVAVAWTHQRIGLATVIVSALLNHAVTLGRRHVFLFTHPGNSRIFRGLGFSEVAGTDKTLLMENIKGGLKRYIQGIEKPAGKKIGCVMANCHPFTNGHLHLIEAASRECDFLHVFIFSNAGEDELPCEVRRRLAIAGTRHLANVVVQPASHYLMPPHAFPESFAEDRQHAGDSAGDLDLVLFADGIANPLGVTRRYVGEETGVSAPGSYQRKMRRSLPSRGIDMIEVEKLRLDGVPVSGARVRSLCINGKWEEVSRLVPPSTLSYLVSHAPK